MTPEDQPIYGIQARGFIADGGLPETLNAIVAESLERMRAIDSRGPYHLLGWSFGGIVAHMIATQLQSEGYEVDRLLLFDSYPPNTEDEGPHRNMDEIWREIALGTNLAIALEEPRSELNAEVILTLARKQSHILSGFSLQRLNRLATVLANNSRLVPTAKLGVFEGETTLFIARLETKGLDRTSISAEAWHPFCHGPLRKIDVNAEHHQMLSTGALRQVASILR